MCGLTCVNHLNLARGLDGDKVSRVNFPIPQLQARLQKAASDLHLANGQGKGFCIVRGLDPARYSAEDNVILHLAIASHVGGDIRGVQDRRGNVLGEKLPPVSFCLFFFLTCVTISKFPLSGFGIFTRLGYPLPSQLSSKQKRQMPCS
jgi:hypothetical protein